MVFLSSPSTWCIVQSDNRKGLMQQASFNSYEGLTADHRVFDCSAVGAGKPGLVLHQCSSSPCNFIIWADSDSVYAPPPGADGNDVFARIESLFREGGPRVKLIAGFDHKATNAATFKRQHKLYTQFFNDGVFAVRCANATDFLSQWVVFTKSAFERSDQASLQWMADSSCEPPLTPL